MIFFVNKVYNFKNMTSFVDQVNNYIKKFMESQDCDESLISAWLSEDNQEGFTLLIPKKTLIKRSKTAYNLFCQKMRSQVKEENPDMKSTEITSELSRLWKEFKEDVDRKDELAEYEKFVVEEKQKLGISVKSTGIKKPKSSYLHFCQRMRSQVKEDNPEMKATEITSELGRLWQELKEDDDRKEELAEYEQLALEEKEVYDALPADEKVVSKKRGKSAYVFFCKSNRSVLKEENPDMSASEITSELSRLWKELKEDVDKKDELAEYEQLAAEDKERVKNEPENVEKKSKKARSAYLFFCERMRSQVKEDKPDMKSTEVTSELGRLWKELKADKEREEELAEYEQLAAEDKERVGVTTEKKSKKVSQKGNKKKVEKKKDSVEEVKETKPVVKSTVVTNMKAYSNFKKQKTEEIKKKDSSMTTMELNKKISKMWQDLSDKQQKEYN